MNAGEIKERVYRRLDEDPSAPVYYTPAEVLLAINVGLRLFGLLTLSVERTANFTLSGGTCWYTISSQITDCIKILRVRRGAARVQPTTFHEQDCYSLSWEATAGTPAQYLTVGVDLLAITPQPAGADTISITYAAVPTELTADPNTPEIPEEYHPELVDFACFFLRLKEGGQELRNEIDGLQRFFDAVLKLAIYVRARVQAQGYDVTPPYDIKRRDQSRRIKMDLKKGDMPKAA